MRTAGGTAAFFDVDETLIKVKSMFHFLDYYLAQKGEPPATYQRLTDELRRAAATGVPRQEINRRYYRLYAGESASAVAKAGVDWFASQPAGALFVAEVVEELRAHQNNGHLVVLLSGSFFACLTPIAEALGVNWALGTRPVVRRDTLTGEVLVPMIGETKARAAQVTAAVRGMALDSCSAYGDHASDLALLETVGLPVVVGDDPVLRKRSSAAGWRRLPVRTDMRHSKTVTGEEPK